MTVVRRGSSNSGRGRGKVLQKKSMMIGVRHGSSNAGRGRGRPRINTEEMRKLVQELIQNEPEIKTKRIAELTKISVRTAQRICNDLGHNVRKPKAKPNRRVRSLESFRSIDDSSNHSQIISCPPSVQMDQDINHGNCEEFIHPAIQSESSVDSFVSNADHSQFHGQSAEDLKEDLMEFLRFPPKEGGMISMDKSQHHEPLGSYEAEIFQELNCESDHGKDHSDLTTLPNNTGFLESALDIRAQPLSPVNFNGTNSTTGCIPYSSFLPQCAPNDADLSMSDLIYLLNNTDTVEAPLPVGDIHVQSTLNGREWDETLAISDYSACESDHGQDHSDPTTLPNNTGFLESALDIRAQPLSSVNFNGTNSTTGCIPYSSFLPQCAPNDADHSMSDLIYLLNNTDTVEAPLPVVDIHVQSTLNGREWDETLAISDYSAQPQSQVDANMSPTIEINAEECFTLDDLLGNLLDGGSFSM